MHQIINTIPEHVQQILPVVRDADIAEFWAADHKTPEQALTQSMMCSTETKTGMVDGQVVCIFGVAPINLLCGQAMPWMIGSSLIDKYARIFLKHDKGIVDDWLNVYPHLFNYVDARNTKAKAWLKRLGFVLGEAVPYGKEQLPFHYFERKK